MSQNLTRVLFLATAMTVVAPAGYAQPSPSTQPDRGRAISSVVGRLLSLSYERSATSVPVLSGTDDPALTLPAAVQAGRWEVVGNVLAGFSPDDAVRVHQRIVAGLLQDTGEGFTASEALLVIGALPSNVRLADQEAERLGQLLKSAARGSLTPETIQSVINGVGPVGGVSPAGKRYAAILLVTADAPDAASALIPETSQQATDMALRTACLVKKARLSEANGDPTRAKEYFEEAGNSLITAAVSLPPGSPDRASLVRALTRLMCDGVIGEALEKQVHKLGVERQSLLTEMLSQLAVSSVAGDSVDARTSRLVWIRRLTDEHLSTGTPLTNPMAADQLLQPWLTEVRASGAANVNTADRPTGGTPRRNLGAQQQPQVPPNVPQTLAAETLLSLAPSRDWYQALSDSSKRRVLNSKINLLNQLGQTDKALEIAADFIKLSPESKSEVCETILQGWTRNHDRIVVKPVANQSRSMALPVTGTVQRSNLAELSSLINSLRKLTGSEPPTSAVSAAFFASVDSSSVQPLSTIEDAFGPLPQINSDVLSTLIDRMRQLHISSVRQLVSVRGAATDADIVRVKAGYQTLADLAKALSTARPHNAAAELLEAQMVFEQSESLRLLRVDPNEWIPHRNRSFALFEKSVKSALEATQTDSSVRTDALHQWFFAGMGALEPNQLNNLVLPDLTQIDRLRDTLNAFSKEVSFAERSRLASRLCESYRRISADSLVMFVQSAISVVGEVPSASPLYRYAAYYKALSSEMALSFEVDGDKRVGVDAPFGVQVSLLQSDQLDREVGSFGRIFQNLPPRNAYLPNVSPTLSSLRGRADYRERIEGRIRQALSSQFEVQSIAWADGKTRFALPDRPGWGRLPLAYVLLKAKDASVSSLPAVQVEFDFADRADSEMVYIPVRGEPFPINAAEIQPRPFTITDLKQTLNSRELTTKGLATLDVVVQSQGVPPVFDQLFEFPAGSEFEVTQCTAQPLSLDRYVQTNQNMAAQFVQQWTLTLRPTTSQPTARLSFPVVKPTFSPPTSVSRQMYTESDLVAAEASMIIQLRNGTSNWLYAGLGIAVIILGAGTWLSAKYLSRGKQTQTQAPVEEALTPFAALTLLRELERSTQAASVAESVRRRLAEEIAGMEVAYAQEQLNDGSTLENPNEMVRKWRQTLGITAMR